MKSHQLEDKQASTKAEPLQAQPPIESTDHLAKFRLELENKDKEISELKNHQVTLCLTLEREQSKVVELERRKSLARNEVQELRSNISKLQRDLQICRDDLFRVQPLAHISDTEIQRRYEEISQQISNWVDNAISISEARIGSETNLFRTKSRCIADLFNTIPNAGEYLLVAMIHHHITEWIFGEQVYLFGLQSQAIDLLQRAEKAMASLEPHRGPASVDSLLSSIFN